MKRSLFAIAGGLALTMGCDKGTPSSVAPSPTRPLLVVEREPVWDVDGNSYRTVQIGNQVWTAENLRTTTYNDGQPIVQGWAAPDISPVPAPVPAYCWYDNNPSQGATYGALYNWYAVATGRLAPPGWHVPSDAEWVTLINYLGGESTAGGRMKEAGNAHWVAPNTGATNESGFTALPSGVYVNPGVFDGMGRDAYMWSSTATGNDEALLVHLLAGVATAARYPGGRNDGFAVRCIRD